MINMFKNIYQYRELLKSNIKKEIRGKYKHSFLGVLWSFLNPLLQLAVYAIIFPLILKNTIENYVIFMCVALIPWNFFTIVVNQSTGTVINNADIVKKVYFPREILPISVATSQLVNFLISTIIILIFVVCSGIGFSWHLIFYPIVLLIQYIFSIGIAFIVSSVTVFLRDLEHLINIALMMLFYAAPIVYPAESLTGNLSLVITLNPVAHILIAYRDIFYYQRIPNMYNLGIVALVSVVIFLVGYAIFNKLQKGFAEEL